ncbi:hypothetical protein KJW28_20545 [Pseudomonas syringae pv. aptata]|uniref:Uncharacterized protein n=1 Tax=Pseudomonas syringae TaxID=317 RepID=A0AB38C3T4_PSESX|nr:hypothetical protein [Pseudomonas syringae]MCK0549991.1 hypothetical protein [Pseudomonas syringae pv. aptata]SFO51334.1 hypothetical protein SAMN05444065_12610 [Pseudomonas syringae]SFO92864.1 hypothetical protein SAMN05444063_12910 [Pseudomonas syringae]
MKKLLQNATSWSEKLTARKAHLNTLLKNLNATSAKMSQIQSLTIKAIKAELTYIESQLIRRK